MRRRRRNNPKADLFSVVFVLFIFLFFINFEFVKFFFEKALVLVFLVLFFGVLFYVFYSLFLNKNKIHNGHPPQPSKKRTHLKSQPLKVNSSPTKIVKNTKDEWSQSLINSLEWKRFEELCCQYCTLIGYSAKLTGKGADGGIDIELFKNNYALIKPYGIVQCKAWEKNKIGVKHIRELYGVMASEGVPLGVFITTGRYTPDAIAFSQGKDLDLISGNELFKRIQLLPEKEQDTLLKNITSGDFLTPTCPSCDVKMTLRTSKKGRNIGRKFWGCKNYPRCRSIFQIKT